MASRLGAFGLVTSPRGRTTKYQLPVCVVPDIFALNVSTQQVSGGVLQKSQPGFQPIGQTSSGQRGASRATVGSWTLAKFWF